MSRLIGAGIRSTWIVGSLLLAAASAGLSPPAVAGADAQPGATATQPPGVAPAASGGQTLAQAGASQPSGQQTAQANPPQPATPQVAQANPPQAANPQVAQANSPPPADQQVAQAGTSGGQATGSQALEEVVVTGSHIQESTFTSPTPITVINSQMIQSLGLINAGDVLNEIPSNSNFTSAANIGLGNFYIGAQFANLRGLDPFFGTRTLTLVDGQRFVPTAAGGQVDLNVIPSIMIDREDVVTGGGSAAYGSDAIAGVVNIILNNNYQGFKLQVDGGETSYGDGGDMHVAAMWGKAFLDNRLHNVLAAEYEDSQGIGFCGEVRPWCEDAPAQYTNTGYLTDGLPHYIIGPNATSYFPYNGMLDSLGPAGVLGMFNSSGTALVPFNPGTYGSGAGAFTATQAGSGPNYYDGVTIRPPVTHWSLYDHATYDITDTLQASLDVSFAQRRSTNTQAADGAYGAPANVILPTNPYLPASVSAAMDGAPAFFYDDVGNQLDLQNSTENNVGRAVLGLKGNLFDGWTWDGYYEWGENGTRERLANDIVEYFGVSPLIGGSEPANTYDFFNWALNAAVNPANGQIQCAATIPGNPSYNPLAVSTGCVPLDLFGTGKASEAALEYAYRTLHQDSAFTQDVISATAHGNLFSGWGAGPIAAAIGVEDRHNMASVTHDLAQQPWYSQYFLSYGQDYSGDLDDIEGFGEVNIPFLKDLPLARNLALDLSVRETQFKDSNTLTGYSATYDFPSWKAGLVWDPVDWLRFRATQSRDTRAPSFYELWAQTVDVGGLFGTVANPWVNPPGSAEFGVPVDVARVASGSSSPTVGLRPEQANTSTLGLVVTPEGALDGLQVSGDWYDIVIYDAIANLGASDFITACYDGYKYYCQFISGTPNGTGGFSNITGVNSYNLNIGSYVTRGFDYEVDYKLPLSRIFSSRNDSLDFRVLATYQYDETISPGAGLPVYNYAGVSGPAAAFGDFNFGPKWQGNAFVTYNNGPFTGVLQAHVIGEGLYEAVDTNTNLPMLAPGDPGYSTTYAASINNNHVPSITYVNLTLNYTLPFFNKGSQSLQVFGTINNLFNRYPPIAPGGNGYPTNPVYFDTYGFTWRVGLRVQF